MKRLPLCLLILVFFISGGPVAPPVRAEVLLPSPGTMVYVSPVLNPPVMRGLKVDEKDPFHFRFLLDTGGQTEVHTALDEGSLRSESNRLIKYFLAALTVPEQDIWVNLSPYEKKRIVPEGFGRTAMGRDLLAQDYILKQLTASLVYPEGAIGKKFWAGVYARAAAKMGSANIPVRTFNKVWILPDKAVVYENAKQGTVYITQANLKVMLEEDYLALKKNAVSAQGDMGDAHAAASDMVRKVILPELNREVNTGKNFAQLRQVYYSLILAVWYKRKIRESILTQAYADKNKVSGLQSTGSQAPQEIYRRYLEAFRKGVYSYIKEEPDARTNRLVPRKYFSGGFVLAGRNLRIDRAMTPPGDGPAGLVEVETGMRVSRARRTPVDAAMLGRIMDAKIRQAAALGQKVLFDWLSAEERKLMLDHLASISPGQNRSAFIELNAGNLARIFSPAWQRSLEARNARGIIAPADLTLTPSQVRLFIGFLDLVPDLELPDTIGGLSRLQEESFEDINPLTGLYGRKRMGDLFRRRVQHTMRSGGGRLLVFMLDLDNFKSVNDLGYAEGDKLLRNFADVMSHNFRSWDGDVMARWGGEEFIGIMPIHEFNFDTDAILDRFLRRVREEVHIYRGRDRSVRAGWIFDKREAVLQKLRDAQGRMTDDADKIRLTGSLMFQLELQNDLSSDELIRAADRVRTRVTRAMRNDRSRQSLPEPTRADVNLEIAMRFASGQEANARTRQPYIFEGWVVTVSVGAVDLWVRGNSNPEQFADTDIARLLQRIAGVLDASIKNVKASGRNGREPTVPMTWPPEGDAEGNVPGGEDGPGDRAMAAEAPKGGIDFNGQTLDVRTDNAGQALRFRVNPRLLKEIQGAEGVEPNILKLAPVLDVRQFLGIAPPTGGTLPMRS